MQIDVLELSDPNQPLPAELTAGADNHTLVVVFASPALCGNPVVLDRLRTAFPRSTMTGCSTAGEIIGTSLRDHTAVLGVLRFRDVVLHTASAPVWDLSGSFDAGQAVALQLADPALRALLVFSDGTQVNGSELVRGLRSSVDDNVVISGGLAGDGGRFERTYVIDGGEPRSATVTAVGLYGDSLIVGHGSRSGWHTFGLERTITAATGNVLHELDGRPALDLYCDYLGDLVAGLPASALLFPLAVRVPGQPEPLVRTVLGVDHDARSLTFAGDMPVGGRAQLMRANLDRLVDGAAEAAEATTMRMPSDAGPSLTLAISCVGRRLVLGERTEEELEAVADGLPAGHQLMGFYSYGELSPHATGRCELHNQTMTLTTFAERCA